MNNAFKNLALQSSRAAKRLIFAALIFSLGIASVPASAQGIQMLPPVTEDTKTYPDKDHKDQVPTTCSSTTTGGSPNILTWDGTHPITCAKGVTVTGSNVGIGTKTPQAALDVNGEARVGDSGADCTSSNLGAIRYDTTTNQFLGCKLLSDSYIWGALTADPTIVHVIGGWFAQASNDAWYANAAAYCPSGYIATGGGGYCDEGASAWGASLIYANPIGNNGFYASCFGGSYASSGITPPSTPGGIGAKAYVYCVPQ